MATDSVRRGRRGNGRGGRFNSRGRGGRSQGRLGPQGGGSGGGRGRGRGRGSPGQNTRGRDQRRNGKAISKEDLDKELEAFLSKDEEGRERVTKLKREELDSALDAYMAGAAEEEAGPPEPEAQPEAAAA